MSPYELKPFAYQQAGEEAFAAYTDFFNQKLAERQPDDPPRAVAELMENYRSIPPFVQLEMWAVWQGEAVVAAAEAQITLTEENAHVMQFDIYVLPAHRRQGLGRRLLQEVTAAAQREKRPLLICQTYGAIPAGEAFMRRLGAQPGLAAHVNQLALADVDPALLQRWTAVNDDRAAFVLEFWDGPAPESDINALVALYEVMNQQPRGELDVEDFHVTAEQLRQIEQSMSAGGGQKWTLVARELATGELAGFTEVVWRPSRPHLLGQGNTGVFPRFRGRGLGKWLKAAMLQKVMAERPSVQFIRTGNADANAPMLAINRQLGFRPYLSQTLWQVKTERVAGGG